MIVPRTENPDDSPWQITNDLICNAAVWRNGGSDENTHICDDCIRIGLRHIKLKVDALLGEIEADTDKDAELDALTQRIGRMQHRHQSLAYEHDRMQTRLARVLEILDAHGIKETDDIKFARWEVQRGPSERDRAEYLFLAPARVQPPENAGTQRPGTPDGSLATETRKPGSLK